MIARFMAMAFVAASAVAMVAPGRPADIDPRSQSRLPPLDRAGLSPEGQRVYDVIRGDAPAIPLSGPAPISMYSPGVAEPMHRLNQYLRKTVVGPRHFELAALTTAREFDQAYEWTGHEPAGRRAGLEPAVIDVVKFKRPTTGLQEKDATVIELGRALLREHKVSPELWGRAVALFGQQGAVEIVATVGDYALAAVMLTAADQQLPPERPSLLPVR
jgi:4-carboxymuconolactone decarboxylase